MVIGGHGDTTMIPLPRLASYNGAPVSQFLDKKNLDKVVSDTMVGGATLTKLLGTSAWYAPASYQPRLRGSAARSAGASRYARHASLTAAWAGISSRQSKSETWMRGATSQPRRGPRMLGGHFQRRKSGACRGTSGT